MKLDQLTFTRFLAAMVIVVFHYGRTVWPFNAAFLVKIWPGADVGVSYFFILYSFGLCNGNCLLRRASKKGEYYFLLHKPPGTYLPGVLYCLGHDHGINGEPSHYRNQGIFTGRSVDAGLGAAIRCKFKLPRLVVICRGAFLPAVPFSVKLYLSKKSF
nr:hypothetical protein [Mucilaginibacter rivuli]